jgi:glutathione synthase/RimK-type ligase-like ATP-grasp enzyme
MKTRKVLSALVFSCVPPIAYASCSYKESAEQYAKSFKDAVIKGDSNCLSNMVGHAHQVSSSLIFIPHKDRPSMQTFFKMTARTTILIQQFISDQTRSARIYFVAKAKFNGRDPYDLEQIKQLKWGVDIFICDITWTGKSWEMTQHLCFDETDAVP